jgi:hypothetical protein
MRPRYHLLAALSLALGFFVATGLPSQALAQESVMFGFPHLANGDTGNGIWQTNFVFVNNSPYTASGWVGLFGDNGQPLALATSQGTDSDFFPTIPPLGTYEIETSGAGSVTGGYAIAEFDHSVIGSAIYSLKTSQGKMVSVGVPSNQSPVETFVAPVTDRTGIALVNIYSVDNVIDLLAYDPSGNMVSSAQITLGPQQHIAKNMIDFAFTPAIPQGFRGSTYIYSENAKIAALAIGFESNNVPLYVSWSYSNILYNSLRTAYSGAFTLTAGPNAGGSGTIEASNLEHFDSDMFTGNISTTMGGLVRTGTFLGISDDFELMYSFYLTFQGASNRGLAMGELQSDNSISGTIVDDGEGNSGTFTLTPDSGSGYTLRRPGHSPLPKTDLRGGWRRFKPRK